MGAVTAIMYGDRDPTIAGMVLDSPFSSLKLLVEELVKDKVNLPNFVINQALKLVKSTVQKKANFKLDDIEPVKFAERCFIPALFVAANNDNFVKPHHAKILHDIYPGDKNLVNIEGDHNSHRPRFFKDSATIFFYNTLQVQYIKEISDNYAGFYKRKNDIFEEDKKNKEDKNNSSNNDSDNNDNINHRNRKKNMKNGEIPLVINDINLNNIDFESVENEEEILKAILEKSRKHFEDMELKNKQYPNLNSNKNNKIGIDVNNNILKNITTNIKNEIEMNKNDLDNNLFDFLNSQVKTNNKDSAEDIKKPEKKDIKFVSNDKDNELRDSNLELKSPRNEIDLINLDFDKN